MKVAKVSVGCASIVADLPYGEAPLSRSYPLKRLFRLDLDPTQLEPLPETPSCPAHPSDMPLINAMTDHILWCADQALVVWRQHFPNDHRPDVALERFRVYLLNPSDMQLMSNAMRSSDDAYAAADAILDGPNDYVGLAAAHAARAVARCITRQPTGDVLRDVRTMAAMAQAYHSASKAAIHGASPHEITAIEAQTLEVVREQQDNDLRQRMVLR